MDGVIEFLGFSLGASLATAAIRSSRGLRPLVRGVTKTVLGVAQTAGDAVSNAAADARSQTAQRDANQNAPQKIVIAHE